MNVSRCLLDFYAAASGTAGVDQEEYCRQPDVQVADNPGHANLELNPRGDFAPKACPTGGPVRVEMDQARILDGAKSC